MGQYRFWVKVALTIVVVSVLLYGAAGELRRVSCILRGSQDDATLTITSPVSGSSTWADEIIVQGVATPDRLVRARVRPHEADWKAWSDGQGRWQLTVKGLLPGKNVPTFWVKRSCATETTLVIVRVAGSPMPSPAESTR